MNDGPHLRVCAHDLGLDEDFDVTRPVAAGPLSREIGGDDVMAVRFLEADARRLHRAGVSNVPRNQQRDWEAGDQGDSEGIDLPPNFLHPIGSKDSTVDSFQVTVNYRHMSDAPTSVPTIAQLRENSLSGIVRHELERLILGGELPAGSRVNENAIANRLGVSRGPVREACRALVGLGLLDLVPNRGVFVRRMDRQDVQEIYDLRAGLVGLAGALLAPKVTDAQIERLKALLEEMESAADLGDFERFYATNLEFHDVILQFAGNSRLIKTYRALVTEFRLVRTHGMVQRGALAESNQEHRAIVDALASGDPQAAYDASFRHVAQGKRRMLAALDSLAHEVTGRPKVEPEGRYPVE